jgi:tetratricopeptide (TPR) repeat protein
MRLLIIFTIFLLFSCQNASLQEQTAIPESHTQMVAMLDSLNRVAFPIDNYQLNTRRVKFWKDKMGNPDAPVHIEQGYWLNMVYEMLGAGQLDTAIYELTQKIKEIPDKTLYDMLAVAYLRLGERQNCVENHTSASCIVPLAKEGWHSLPLGSQSAIQLYERILQVAPDDLQSRYLLNIAYMTLGQYPLGVPEEYRIP